MLERSKEVLEHCKEVLEQDLFQHLLREVFVRTCQQLVEKVLVQCVLTVCQH